MSGLFKFIGASGILFLLLGGVVFAEGYKEIGTAEVKALMEKDKKVQVVFPLSKIEYDNLHIAGSLHIPLGEFKAKLPADHTTPLVFYCIGDRSTTSWRAAESAIKLGYLNVYAYREGLPAWVAAGYPTATVEKIPDAWVEKISTEQLAAKLTGNENIVLLDCNLESDVQKLKIDSPRRVYIPLEELHTRYKELPKNRTIAVICLTGMRSPAAARFLLSKGFSSVVSVDGGVQRWVVEKRPIIRNIGG